MFFGFGYSQDSVVTSGIQHGGLVDVRDVVHDVALHAKHIPVDRIDASVKGCGRRIAKGSPYSGGMGVPACDVIFGRDFSCVWRNSNLAMHFCFPGH